MPFTRISLRAGRSAAQIAAIRDALYEALTSSFDVPADDSFMAFHQHAPGELLLDAHYGGGPRSSDAMVFEITTGRRRSEEMTKVFLRRLVANLGQMAGIRPEDVMVIFVHAAPADWSFGSGRLMSEMTMEELGRAAR